MKHILLIENHSIVRLATLFIIRDVLPEVASWETDNFPDALHIVSTRRLDLIFLDINIPDGEGFQMIAKIRRLQPGVTIMVFSDIDEELYAMHYLKAGANGFLSKSSSTKEIRTAIAAILTNGRYVSEMVQRLLLHGNTPEMRQSNPLAALSQREIEVMDLLLEGKWTKEIATLLNITGSSVSTYKLRIFEKLGVNTVIELYQKVNALRE
ncbi:DNA-binding NarL/FixJ family response regulator [Dyadobacter sp. BE34]|uniref:DNA-binding NarL/FixJ family response regulator n=1 Tax=Dyadobacter fermentans TaxID=94254 RepID=A0ABU1R1N4_9BACT|nr:MULTISPECIES: response regulator transcription factor [Dyadobacter]MDR6807313.1 DNA-binding NarL/FixJ family response regulator [Dyadobacter fermentans]MDR7045054.1 DNA-binding NarL/FixJ family response regulator [Dyadobacter sp. BE242]MDR7199210.1 DNA-binding NarL/FixJ family response regulator [Dyadobacter sp. BE34]MDR7217170.1 DNA-binding NarL/FixJ family response regulator [Dyadobacter sp. BE31]MDR7265103.1 DNA-binding NarL/FixJ family response regulator [Dyadobacter sp. BE32]